MGNFLTENDQADARQMGGKGAALAGLSGHGLPIPRWIIVPPLMHQQGGMTEELAGAITQAAADLSPQGQLLAVRSSAVDEDGDEHSFAGLLESYLFVPVDQVATRVADVWHSGSSPRVLSYRHERGLAGPPAAPAVLIQQMVDAQVSGVAFAADPVSGSRSTLVISAVFGLGTALVGGDADADWYHLDQNGNVLKRQIARKTIRHVQDHCAAQGVREESVDEVQAVQPTLDESMLRQVAELVMKVSRLRGRPQDIEWAVCEGKLFLLQARPITSLAGLPDPQGAYALWDNANIAESYNGITTPLTFTFAQRAYEGAYRQFCRIMRVSGKSVADHDAMFGQMLGLIRGRVYYNLLNWYRLLAMLPGYSVNQKFMEQMMGVGQGLPAEVSLGAARRNWMGRQADRFRLGLSLLGLMWNHFVLPGKIRAFNRRLDEALKPPERPLVESRLDELAASYRRLESQLVTRWDAPLINDFLAMIFFGLLGKLCVKWCPGSSPALHNDLIGDEGGIISMEPAQRIGQMAKLAAEDESLVQALCESDRQATERLLATKPALQQQVRQYLDKFGDRCLEELKLESIPLTENPLPLYGSIGQAARRLGQSSTASRPFRPRQTAEDQVARAMQGHGLRRTLFQWVLKNARHRVRDRENLRFERTRLFGRIRRIFVEIGRRLQSEGRLRESRDIFYLGLHEILAFVEGTSTLENLSALAELRKKQSELYRSMPVPAERFQTRGAVYVGNRFEAISPPGASTTGDMQGTGCCPGIVAGPVRVIRDPRGAHLSCGEILVAERTDPGWIMLFPAAAAILVERGSLLSHSAIVAREMGIPAIVSVPGLTSSLTDGQWVRIDGSTGVISRIDPPEVNAHGAREAEHEPA